MKKILQYSLSVDRREFVLIIILSIAVALTGGLGTVMLVPMLDLLDIELGGQLGGLTAPLSSLSFLERAILIISIFVVLMLFRAGLSAANSYMQSRFLEKFEMSLRDTLYDRIADCDWQSLSKIKHTELSNLLLNQCRQARFCIMSVLGLFSSAASAALQLAIACWMSTVLTLPIFIAGLVFVALLRPFQHKLKKCGEESVELYRELYAEVGNQLSGIKETRAYGVSGESERLYREVSYSYFDLNKRMAKLRVIPQICYSVAAAILIAAAFVISVLILKTDTAVLVIMVYIFSRLWPLFSSWQTQMQRVQTYLPAFEKVLKMTERLGSDAVTSKSDGNPIKFRDKLELSGVCFAYKDGNEDVLRDVSFTLPFGSVTALVGRSGTGKSTIADLLLGLLTPTRGEIKVDGIPLTGENIDHWRGSIGYVPQSPLILDTTIRENLRRFHPDSTEEEMIDALKSAQAWQFVEKLPKGIDTLLGSKGVGLSGGEQQRIVLARVLMGNPRLVILDEATSALDYESENAIRRMIGTLKGRTTVVIIAHRPATIRSADRAIVLEDGRITEDGAIVELIKSDGYLAGMFRFDYDADA